MKRVYAREANVVSREVAGEVFLVPIRGRLADMRRIFVLNPVGEAVWDRIDGTRSLDSICSDVVERFDVSSEVAGADIREFVERLREEDLVKEVTARAGGAA